MTKNDGKINEDKVAKHASNLKREVEGGKQNSRKPPFDDVRTVSSVNANFS